ncbi:hypothetical protein I350_08178 [Cryptococcus amylolentus CBS 6273]|uniref:Zn(2)-C6 fungal-type domain-containing protein n=1 Tax=Cryptococcus amylolentus CBS 6273 TaxID=1296118 RepID=A0A1E3J8K4_9TREE|nr:hypothetical protein I350_08178 [Cryptococcus amylolentus CBS 6273]
MADAANQRRLGRLERACDVCRRKKIRCNRPKHTDTDKCIYCQEGGLECTYNEQAQRRGPPKGYVDALEHRCGRLEKIIQQLDPQLDLAAYAGPQLDLDTFEASVHRQKLYDAGIPSYPLHKPLSSNIGPTASLARTPHLDRFYKSLHSQGHHTDMDAESSAQSYLVSSLKHVGARDQHWRYYGKGSDIDTMRHLSGLLYCTGQTSGQTFDLTDEIARAKRQKYWDAPRWEIRTNEEGLHPVDLDSRPDQVLAQRLINAYFCYASTYLPLLDRSEFQQQHDLARWKQDHGFARVCLLVFACGARFVDDPIVLWPDESQSSVDDPTFHRHSAGWRYFCALVRMGRKTVQIPTLHELQIQVLTCQFLLGAAQPHQVWIIAGQGLRSCQELGIHRRATLSRVAPAEKEALTRAFWCLYHLDRVASAPLGRSVAIYDSDTDVDYPSAINDQTTISVFTLLLRIDHILGATLQTIYSRPLGSKFNPDLYRSSIAEMNTALDLWETQVPPELCWDPTNTLSDYTSFRQTAALHAHYHYTRILVNRTHLIPTPASKADPASGYYRSLVSARALCEILQTSLERGERQGVREGARLDIGMALGVWSSAIIILIDVHCSRQTFQERQRSLGYLRVLEEASEDMELSWRLQGKYTDMLRIMMGEKIMPEACVPSPGRQLGYANDVWPRRFDALTVGGEASSSEPGSSVQTHFLSSKRSTLNNSNTVSYHQYAYTSENAPGISAPQSAQPTTVLDWLTEEAIGGLGNDRGTGRGQDTGLGDPNQVDEHRRVLHRH